MSEGTNKQLKYPSLELIFELTKERLANQTEQSNALDTKANFVLVSATALISAALVLQAALLSKSSVSQVAYIILPSTKSLFFDKFLQSLPLMIFLIAYLVTMIAAFLAYKIRTYREVPDPDELYKTYLCREANDTKAEVFRAMLEAYRENNVTIKSKIFWLRTAFIVLGCEVIAFVIVLFFQTVY